ncbi:MAG TPA: methyltransferase [Acidobacteriaceae bacterium]|nr:methyltransferase [Acidobacteriaceae bacterium]
MRLNPGTVAVAVLLLVFLAWHSRGLPWTPMRLAGAAIAVPGLVLLIVARVQLGSAFSVQAKPTQLVTTGLCSRIRNPIYVFGSLVIAGVILWASRPISLLLVVIVPIQIRRARREQQVLAETFGQSCLGYRRRTWF